MSPLHLKPHPTRQLNKTSKLHNSPPSAEKQPSLFFADSQITRYQFSSHGPKGKAFIISIIDTYPKHTTSQTGDTLMHVANQRRMHWDGFEQQLSNEKRPFFDP